MREADYRGERFKDFKETDDVTNVPISLKGNDDLLALTKPVLVGKIHKEYFEAGSDICETNTVKTERPYLKPNTKCLGSRTS